MSRQVLAASILVLCCGPRRTPPPVPAPEPTPRAGAPIGIAGADGVLEAAVARGVVPGGVFAVGRRSGLIHLRAFGWLSPDGGGEPTTIDTIYDLASLTKAVATTTLAMIFVDEGRLDLDAPLSTWFPAFAGPGRGGARVHHLLSHSSGLPAWAPLSRESRGKEGVIQAVLARDLEYEPGTRSVYSDLGMILLGQIIEHQGGEALDQLARRRVFEPLGMRDTAYRPPASVRERVASTGEDRWRGRVLRGEVQDENAYWMGGVAGHAGLFGTAPNLARFCEMLLRGGDWGGRRLVRSETVDWFARRVEISGSTRTLGWETPAGDRWAGGGWSARAFGHTGLTGTVVWIDPELDVYLVLLTNRIAMGGSDEAFGHVRRQLSEAVTNVVRRGLVVQSTSGASLERSGHAKRATGEGVQGCASADDSTQSGAASPCLLREPAFLSCDLLSSALTRASIREKYRSASNLKPFQPLKR